MRDIGLDHTKWILTILLVLYHINFDVVNDYFLFIKNLGDSVVPAFTIISGFLFFRTVKDLSDLKGKYKRRVGSLVIPYIVWNFINTFLLNTFSLITSCKSPTFSKQQVLLSHH